MYVSCHLSTVVAKHTKLDAPEVGTSVFHFVGTLGEGDGDRVILVSYYSHAHTFTSVYAL